MPVASDEDEDEAAGGPKSIFVLADLSTRNVPFAVFRVNVLPEIFVIVPSQCGGTKLMSAAASVLRVDVDEPSALPEPYLNRLFKPTFRE